MSSVLVTGAAGFIGSALVKKLLKRDLKVVGIDNLNSYYSVNLKLARLKSINDQNNNLGSWLFKKISLQDKDALKKLFNENNFQTVINLAAQAGVRYSIENPSEYIESNIVGFNNILENCKEFKVSHLIYASSSSVYGLSKNMPFSERHEVNNPISVYAATKISNENMAYVSSHLYGIKTTGLRFFTVYGPWGRPDMAPMIFTKRILSKEPIYLFNNGLMERDFTYIDDVIKGILICFSNKLESDRNSENKNFIPHEIFNIGNGKPIKLNDFIQTLEEELKVKAIKELKPIQPGDVISTSADISKLNKLGYIPETSLKKGIKKFLEWYSNYYKKNF